jgi:hypothetical protein
VVKISAQLEHFSVLVLKGLKILSVIVNFGFLNLFLDTWIQNPDLDFEYRSRIQAQIECGSNWIQIRIWIQNTEFRVSLQKSRVIFLAQGEPP